MRRYGCKEKLEELFMYCCCEAETVYSLYTHPQPIKSHTHVYKCYLRTIAEMNTQRRIAKHKWVN